MKRTTQLIFTVFLLVVSGLNAQVCDTPINFAITPVSAEEVALSWDPAPGSAPVMYQYAFDLLSDFVPAQGPTTSNLTASNLDAGSYGALIPGATYYAYLRSFCLDSGSGTTSWSDWTTTAIVFTMPCDVATLPYSEDFELVTLPDVPLCTSLETFAGSAWESAANPDAAYTGNVLKYGTSTSDADSWFFTKGVALEAGVSHSFSFTYGNDNTAMSEGLIVAYGLSADAAGMTYVMNDFTAINSGAGVANPFVITPFIVQTTGVYYFGFKAKSLANQGSLYIDSILIKELECNAPDNIAITSISETSVDFSWDPPVGGENAVIYQYSVVPAGGTPADNLAPTPGFTGSVSGLDSGVTYHLCVRNLCTSFWSDWSTPIEFVTSTAGTSIDVFTGLKVYPNPTSSMVTITNATAIDGIEIFDVTGKKLYASDYNSTDITLNISNYKKGFYILSLSSGDVKSTIKLVKE